VTATTSLITSDSIDNIINDSGLSTPVSLTSTHARLGNFFFAGQLTSTTDHITFNLNGSYSLAGFSLWAGNKSNNLKTATIQSSTDGTNFTNIGSSSFLSLPFSSTARIPAQQIVFDSPVTAAYVRFLPLTNFVNTNGGVLNTTDNSVVGLGEVKFNSASDSATSVPEPVTILGTLTAVGGSAALKRRLRGVKSKSL
jgi:hypothetical protein